MSFTAVGLGEIVWDLLPAGPVLGGAPANFAYHARALGADATIVSRIGDDPLGREATQLLASLDLPTDTIQVDGEYPTGAVTVTLSADGVPHFTIPDETAWDRIEASELALQAVRQADVVCFGSIAQRHPVSRTSIRALLAAAPASALRVFDINLRQAFYSRDTLDASLRLANVLKLNDEEFATLTEMFALRGTIRQRIEQLAGTFELTTVALTSGPDGSLLYREGEWSEALPHPIDVVDTIGAGDAFTAALSLGLLSMTDLDEIHAGAAELARHVCGSKGAMPPLPASARNRFGS